MTHSTIHYKELQLNIVPLFQEFWMLGELRSLVTK